MHRSASRLGLMMCVAPLLSLAGFAAGRWSAPAQRPSGADRAEPSATWAHTPAQAPGGGPRAEDIRAIVRQELNAAGVARALPQEPVATPGGAGAAPASSASPPSSEERAAVEQVRAVLEAAVARRRFSAADRDQWMASFPRLSPEDRFEADRALAAAINRGLALDPGAFPSGRGVHR